MQKDEKSPYRNVIAPYTGWIYGGHAEVPACYVGAPKFCKICNDSEQLRQQACQKLYPGYTTKPGMAVPLDK